VAQLEVAWRAYELRPEPVPTLEPGGEYLRSAWTRSVYPLAQALGVTMRLPPVQPRSRLAHEAAAWARERGRFDEMNEALFRAFFEDGRDIGSAEVLGDLAATIGLDRAELLTELGEHVHLGEVLRDEQLADRYGIRGVPAFVCGGYAVSGVQSADALEEFVRRAGELGDGGEPREALPQPPVGLKRR